MFTVDVKQQNNKTTCSFAWWSFTNFVQIKVPGSLGWLVGWLVVLGLNDPLRQYFGLYQVVSQREGWSGGAMVLGKFPVPGRPTIWI